MKKAVILFLLLTFPLLSCMQYVLPVIASPDSNIWQVESSSDDCFRRLIGSYWSISIVASRAGAYSSSQYEEGSGFRFRNINIPKGSYIFSAKMNLTCHYDIAYVPIYTRIRCEDSDNASTFTDATDFDNRPRTGNFVDWNIFDSWSANTVYESPDFKGSVQEVINRDAWTSGNALVVFWDDFDNRTEPASMRERRVYNYDGDTSKVAKIYIEWALGYPLQFYFNNGGQFRCNNQTLINGTMLIFPNQTIIEFASLPFNQSWVFLKFEWYEGSSFINPYNYTVTSNMTVWCHFKDPPLKGKTPLLFVGLAVVGALIAIPLLIALSKKRRG